MPRIVRVVLPAALLCSAGGCSCRVAARRTGAAAVRPLPTIAVLVPVRPLRRLGGTACRTGMEERR